VISIKTKTKKQITYKSRDIINDVSTNNKALSNNFKFPRTFLPPIKGGDRRVRMKSYYKLPVRNCKPPIGNDIPPIRNHILPPGNYNRPQRNDILPSRNHYRPIGNHSLLLRNNKPPAGNCIRPLGNDILPVVYQYIAVFFYSLN
jgi:hypothetical protein